MTTRSGTGKSGKGSPNDTPRVPMNSCSRHPGTVSSGSCPACVREGQARK